jgi:hypothetical protein
MDSGGSQYPELDVYKDFEIKYPRLEEGLDTNPSRISVPDLYLISRFIFLIKSERMIVSPVLPETL